MERALEQGHIKGMDGNGWSVLSRRGSRAASDVGRDTGASEENASIAKRERPAG